MEQFGAGRGEGNKSPSQQRLHVTTAIIHARLDLLVMCFCYSNMISYEAFDFRINAQAVLPFIQAICMEVLFGRSYTS